MPRVCTTTSINRPIPRWRWSAAAALTLVWFAWDVALVRAADTIAASCPNASATPAGGRRGVISGNRRFVAFVSSATNLVPGGTTGLPLVFVRDLQTNATVLVGKNSAGEQADNECDAPAISDDGRFVVFESTATNLASPTTAGRKHIYIHDRDADGNTVFDEPAGVVTLRVSNGLSGEANSDSTSPAISGNGQFVVFATTATNVIAGGTNGMRQVLLLNRSSSLISLVSRSTGGEQGVGNSDAPSISENGDYIVYASAANNLVTGDANGFIDVFLFDRHVPAMPTTTRVSKPSSVGVEANGQSANARISGNGDWVAFQSKATNLAGTDANPSFADVFVWSRATGSTRVVSVSSAGAQSTGASGATGVAISANGRFVAFDTDAAGLVSGDANVASDVLLHDRDPDGNGMFDENNGQTTLVSLGSLNQQTPLGIGANTPQLAASADGQDVKVVFQTQADDMVIGDSNGQTDVFVRTTDPCDAPGITTDPVSQSVCSGASVMFTVEASGTEPLSYQWRRNNTNIGGATSPSLTITPVNTGSAGNYDCVVTNTCGSATSAAATLTVGTAPQITTQPQSQSVADGGSAMFSVAANSSLPLSFQWRRGTTNLVDGGNLSGTTTSTLTINPVSAADAATNYNCVVSNSCGSVNSAQATLTVNAMCLPPQIETDPQSTAVCVGRVLELTVSAGGTPPLTYQWRKNGANLAGATGATFRRNSAVLSDAGTYVVVVSNACGMDTSAEAVVTVSAGPQIAMQPVAQTVCGGDAAVFSVTATGTSPLTYQWRRGATNLVNGPRISGATTPMLTIDPVEVGDTSSSYACVVTDGCGSVNSALVSLRVNSPIIVDSQPADRTVAAGAATTFTVAVRGANPITFQWKKDGVDIAGAIASSLIVNPVAAAHAGTYVCDIANPCGMMSTTPALLTVAGGGPDPDPDPDPGTPPGSMCGTCGGGMAASLALTGSALLIARLNRRIRRRLHR